MEILKTIPENQVTEKIEHFVVYPSRRLIRVTIIPAREESIDISDLWSKMTINQKAVVKGFFKEIAALALKVPITSITGEFDN